MSVTSIEWTDRTLNPTTGCTQVSPGCDHCYAKTLVDRRLSKNPKSVRYEHPFEEVMLHPNRLTQIASWKTPQRVFVNSMSDLFHRDVPDTFIRSVFDAAAEAPQHTFQILTKRPERMRRWMRNYEMSRCDAASIAAKNVWLGVSIESNDYAWRADMLRDTPASLRFLSIEPMLGSVDAVELAGIDWVIVGGESGRGARPMQLDWVRDVRDRCVALGIPFFFKQHGGETKKRGHEDAIIDGQRHVAWPKAASGFA